jgi:Na+/H+ antiporter NhaC
MWPVLVFGMVTLGAALRYAIKPETHQLKFLGAIALTTVVTSIHATWTCFAAVFAALGDRSLVSEADFTQVMAVGFKECTRVGTLGGLLLSLACLLFAIGVLRTPAKTTATQAG